jgi:hypothetical protein
MEMNMKLPVSIMTLMASSVRKVAKPIFIM